jgi:hypothetical protein
MERMDEIDSTDFRELVGSALRLRMGHKVVKIVEEEKDFRK